MNLRLRKLTLLDYPGKTACTIFTEGCNFRCPFCHNGSLVLGGAASDDVLTIDDVLAFLKKRIGLLDGVCITGGEPTLHRDLPGLIASIHEMGFSVKLDTNGSRPDVLKHLVEAGSLDFVAMDVKNSPERYEETAGVPGFLDEVKESASFLLSGAVDCEFRTTVVHPLHSDKDFDSIGRWISGAKRYYLQNFVDSGDLLNGSGLRAASKQDMERYRTIASAYVSEVGIRGV